MRGTPLLVLIFFNNDAYVSLGLVSRVMKMNYDDEDSRPNLESNSGPLVQRPAHANHYTN